MEKMKFKANQFFAVLVCLVSIPFSVYSEERRLDGVILEGDFRQGGMVIGYAPEGSSIQIGPHSLALSSEGTFVFGFGRDQKPDEQLTATLKNGKTIQIPLNVQKREYDIQKITGVPARTVNPDPKHLARIRSDAKQVRDARNSKSRIKGFEDDFIWPVKGIVTGVYGSQRVFNGEPRRPHFGVDIAASKGTEIQAPADGIITMAHPDLFFSGATMVIDHGYGISTSYLHMSKITVSVGDNVKQGDVIGLVGATGRATGPHLCWRLNWFQERLDPQLLVPISK